MTSDAKPPFDAVADAIRTLIESLPADRREEVLSALARKYGVNPASRAGAVLGQVLRLIPAKTEFSVEDIIRRVNEEGVAAPPKAIYNALTYLKAKGKVRRVGYGRYVF